MKLKSRLKKLEKTVGRAPCDICRDWWQQPIVIRDEKDPPAPGDPDLCAKCGRRCPKDRIFEMVICEQVVPPRPFVEVV